MGAGTGNMLVSKLATTPDNGFTGRWLPRDIVSTIEITHAGRAGSAGFSAYEYSTTCTVDLYLAV